MRTDRGGPVATATTDLGKTPTVPPGPLEREETAVRAGLVPGAQIDCEWTAVPGRADRWAEARLPTTDPVGQAAQGARGATVVAAAPGSAQAARVVTAVAAAPDSAQAAPVVTAVAAAPDSAQAAPVAQVLTAVAAAASVVGARAPARGIRRPPVDLLI